VLSKNAVCAPRQSFYLKRGNELYLIVGITKSHEREMATVCRIPDCGALDSKSPRQKATSMSDSNSNRITVDKENAHPHRLPQLEMQEFTEKTRDKHDAKP